ncbi:hypothetical protein OnM2_031019 [Erysiphe neolycopersici]|uniref:Uncharacterized protein n=1 Tax=Erysiphe neolycopersici TaxID=212602 RepID=A0A420HZ04_9PEZI|nr:hypothetical protein OnM2_031019 [Erysiphe neolycopersici]
MDIKFIEWDKTASKDHAVSMKLSISDNNIIQTNNSILNDGHDIQLGGWSDVSSNNHDMAVSINIITDEIDELAQDQTADLGYINQCHELEEAESNLYASN